MPLATPRDEYASRLRPLTATIARSSRLDSVFIAAKLLAGMTVIVLVVWLAKYHTAQIAYIFLPIALLVFLFIWHERILRSVRRCTRLRSYYEHAVARLDDQWAGKGQTGEQFLDPDHPYARDLDIFGK